MKNKVIKTGTTTIGIVCKDGIILAADKRATAGYLIMEKKTEKVVPITDYMAVTTAGTVSDIQLIVKIIKAQINLKRMRLKKEPSVKEVANVMAMIVYENIRKFSTIPGITGFLLGGKDDSGYYLYEIAPDGSIVQRDDYATDGSGMVMAIGVLDTLYKKNISIDESIKLAVKAINAAMQRDVNTGEGIDVFTITKDGLKKVLTKEIDTTVQI